MIGTSEKRSQDAEEFDQKIKILIVDIEGTTTSISFVKDKLFPYIRENLQVYLKKHWKEPEFMEDLVLLRKQAESDKENGVEGLVPIPAGNDDDDDICQAVLNNILWQMNLDRKTKALKQLQGHVMREGYLNGKLKGHVYDDVQPALKSWTHSGRQVYVYSSGSVAAQKLLFKFSDKGDLLEFFSGHFDTDIGPKVESSSYSNIAKQLNCKTEEMMFLTDIPKEAVAACEAGLHAVLVVRPGNAPLSDDDSNKFRVIKSFDDIVFETSAKRKKMSANEEQSSNNTVANVSEMCTSETHMEVDVDINESKVSEDAPLPSEPQGNTQKKSEEATMLQNGSVTEQKEQQIVETSNEEDSKVKKATEPEKGSDSTSKSVEESVVETKTSSSASVSDTSSSTVKSEDASSKTENINKDTHVSAVKIDTDKKKSSEESQNVTETPKDSKTVESTEKQEVANTTDEQMETDKKCTEEKTDIQKEKIAKSSGETKTVGTSENGKPTGSANVVTTNLIGDAKTVESGGELKTVDSTGEVQDVKTVPNANEVKTVGNEEAKTVDSPGENKTITVETTSTDGKDLKTSAEKVTEPKNLAAKVPEIVKESKISEVAEEVKAPEVVEEIKISKTIEEVKAPEVAEEVKAPEVAEEVKAPEVAEEVKSPEVAEEVKAPEVAEEVKAPEVAEEVKAPDVAEEVKAPEVAEEVKAPEVAEEVKAPEVAKEVKASKDAEKVKTTDVSKEKKIPEIVEEVAEEVKAPEVAEEVKALKVVGEVKTIEIAKEVKASEMADEVKTPEDAEKAKVPKVAKEEKMPEISKEVQSPEIAEEPKAPESSKVVASKTTEETQASKPVHAESMECEEESKTDKSTMKLKICEAVEKASTPVVAGDTEMDSSGIDDTATGTGKENISEVLKKDKGETKRTEENKSLETTEEKMVTGSCEEKSMPVEKDNQVNVCGKITACAENGETDVDMETVPSGNSNVQQNVEKHVSTEKKVPIDVGDDEKKIEDQDSTTRKEEAMETDSQGPEKLEKDTPMDVESAQTSTGNTENVDGLKNESVKDKENMEAVASKTNGINNSHATSPTVKCEENTTDMKILDNESIKLKKTSEESETPKLITPPSAQS